MNSTTEALVIFVLIIVLLMVVAFYGTGYLMKRAARDILRSLRYKNANSPNTAITTESAGIKPRSFLQPGVLRDYKPTALQYLIKSNIVRMVEDGRIYLSEETLEQSAFKDKIR